jgi:glutaredoxin 3
MSNATTKKVIVYSTTWCGYCKLAKQYLTSKNVEFEEVNIEEDPKSADYIQQKTGSAGVPVIQIGDEFILGFDRPKIDAAIA